MSIKLTFSIDFIILNYFSNILLGDLLIIMLSNSLLGLSNSLVTIYRYIMNFYDLIMSYSSSRASLNSFINY